jgi:hypothetical protein
MRISTNYVLCYFCLLTIRFSNIHNYLIYFHDSLQSKNPIILHIMIIRRNGTLRTVMASHVKMSNCIEMIIKTASTLL